MSAPLGPVSRREALGLLLIATALTAYFTWPLMLHPGSLGRLEPGDGQFSVWNVAWVAHALSTSGVGLFDANIFHPHRGTLAYSEPNFGAGLLALPVHVLTDNPYAAHNSAVLIGFVLSVVGMYLLARRLSGSREGALIAAVIFAFCPFTFARTAHIQLLMMWPMPFVLLAFHALADERNVRRGAVLGISIGVQALFCSYYGVLVGLLVGLGILVFAFVLGLWRDGRWWALCVLAAVISVVTVLPVLLPYLRLQEDTGFTRPLSDSQRWAADWRAYLASSAWAHGWILRYIEHWKEVLFPGFTAILLGGFGMFVAFRHHGPSQWPVTPHRAVVVMYASILWLAFWSSFGPDAGLYWVLHRLIPIFSLLRAPARFGLAVTLALSVFAAFGTAFILNRTRDSWRRLVAGVFLLFAVAELSTEIPYLPARTVPRAYKVLAAAPRGGVAEFPFYFGPEERYRQTLYMLGSTAHWQPLVNGYSDFMPADFRAAGPILQSFPDRASFQWLREHDTRYLVFHWGLHNAEDRRRIEEGLRAHPASFVPRWLFGTVHLYEVTGWPQ